MSRVTHFELPADDPERAIAFYRDVFGWTIEKWDGPTEYWLIGTGSETEPGIDGGLARRQEPETGTEITVEVESVDKAVSAVEAQGGKVLRPKRAIPGVGWLAYCQDTEGNTFGVMQSDPSAG